MNETEPPKFFSTLSFERKNSKKSDHFEIVTPIN